MNVVLKLEELFLFLLGIYLFSLLNYDWWWFIALLLTPDIGMFSYFLNAKIGAFTYNLFHHRAIAIIIYLMGIYLSIPLCQLIGILLFSHIAFDRCLGYGLKYEKGFKYTHLGEIGK